MRLQTAETREDAFERVFRANYRAVEAFVRFQYPNVDQTDVVSVTFATAWRRFDDRPADGVRGWLIGIARNTARNALRGRRRRRAAEDAYRAQRPKLTAALHEHDVPPETIDRLSAALDSLDRRDRQVIELAAFHGLSGADLAAALGVSRNTAAVRLHRARQRLGSSFEASA